MKNILLALSLATMTLQKESILDGVFIRENNHFTAHMFYEAAKLGHGENFAISAFSVLTPLAQLSLAAEGVSRHELLQAIGLPSNAIKAEFAHLNKKIKSIQGVELTTANRVYIPKGFEIDNGFKTVCRDVFESEVVNIDFTKTTEAAAAMNNWVETKTNNRIKDLVDPKILGSHTRIVLINSIYFKGQWQTPFEKESTRNRPFYLTKTKTVKIPTMYAEETFLYGESDELKAKLLRLPYVGGKASMLIIVPHDIDDGLKTLVTKTRNPEVIPRATQKMTEHSVKVYLPKFKIETRIELNSVLENMGVKKIFNPYEAGLDHFFKDNKELFVSHSVQKTYISVDEDGTEAAAATNTVISMLSMTIGGKRFNANRPFYFEIEAEGIRIFTGMYTHRT